MNGYVVAMIIGMLFLTGYFLVQLNEDKEVEMEGDYQGPVPLGYDLEHFRETGETIEEVEE